jgi:hypothetical protein
MPEIDYKTVLEALLPHGSLWRPAKSYEASATGEELVTNGTFDTDISGWIDSSVGVGVVQWDAGGYMHLLNPDPDPSDYARADQQIGTTEAGIQYQITFDIIAGSVLGGTVEIGAAQGGSSLLNIPITTTGSYSRTFLATGLVTWVGIEFAVNSDVGMKIDNISIVALTSTVTVGKGLWQLLIGMADNHQIALDFLRELTYIRDPRRTPILDDLEREFGIWPNPALTEQVRRDKLAAVKYARVGTGSKDNLERALHNAGFTNLFVWENSPAQDPAIFFGGAEMYCQESEPLFVAVADTGTNNRVMTSPLGVTWTSRDTTGKDNDWKDVIYGGGRYVAIANSGTANRAMYSDDGVLWYLGDTTGLDNAWRGITWGAGKFVAVGAIGITNRAMTSEDGGETWTAQDTTGLDNPWRDVVFGNGIFVAVASSGTNQVMTSPDGETWTGKTAASTNGWRALAYSRELNRFVAVAVTGTGDRVMTSDDNGETWTTRTSAADNNWQAVAWGDGKFVAVSNDGTANRVMTSPDGITWTSKDTTGKDNDWQKIDYRNGRFVAVAKIGTGNRVMTSDDAGETWTLRASAADNDWFGVAHGNVPESLAQCGEPLAQCGKFEGELIVNGDIFLFDIDYIAECGEPLAQCDEPTALAGNSSGVTRTLIEYPIPTDPPDWPFVFFVGGDATFNPDTGASLWCGEALAQCGEPLAFAQWFEGELQDIEFVDLPYTRRADLVRLILQIKPIHSWCALLVNFT